MHSYYNEEVILDSENATLSNLREPGMVITKRGLIVPKDYYTARQSQLDDICNGCGPGGWKFDLIPDTIYGINVNGACNPHDYCYHFGETIEDKQYADLVFLYNLRVIVNETPQNFVMKFLRERRVLKYYYAVHLFGDSAFEAD